MNRLLLAGSLMLLLAAVLTSLPSDRADAGQTLAPTFGENVDAFVKLQKSLAEALPAEPGATEAERMVARQHALAKALTTARRDARQGDLFTPVVAARFRAIIRDAFDGQNGANMRRTLAEGDPVSLGPMHVNDLYPENAPFVTMPPTLLKVLPPLPQELSYRIVGRALVLKDVDTNVIVDVLPDAIPAAVR